MRSHGPNVKAILHRAAIYETGDPFRMRLGLIASTADVPVKLDPQFPAWPKYLAGTALSGLIGWAGIYWWRHVRLPGVQALRMDPSWRRMPADITGETRNVASSEDDAPLQRVMWANGGQYTTTWALSNTITRYPTSPLAIHLTLQAADRSPQLNQPRVFLRLVTPSDGEAILTHEELRLSIPRGEPRRVSVVLNL